MLLVAQRVVSRAHRVQGINSYRYRHEATPWPADPRTMFDAPNRMLVRKSVQLRPGGNRVLSFLDVAAPEEIGTDELLCRLKEFLNEPQPLEFPVTRVFDRCAVRLGLEQGLVPTWRGECEDLARFLIIP